MRRWTSALALALALALVLAELVGSAVAAEAMVASGGNVGKVDRDEITSGINVGRADRDEITSGGNVAGADRDEITSGVNVGKVDRGEITSGVNVGNVGRGGVKGGVSLGNTDRGGVISNVDVGKIAKEHQDEITSGLNVGKVDPGITAGASLGNIDQGGVIGNVDVGKEQQDEEHQDEITSGGNVGKVKRESVAGGADVGKVVWDGTSGSVHLGKVVRGGITGSADVGKTDREEITRGVDLGKVDQDGIAGGVVVGGDAHGVDDGKVGRVQATGGIHARKADQAGVARDADAGRAIRGGMEAGKMLEMEVDRWIAEWMAGEDWQEQGSRGSRRRKATHVADPQEGAEDGRAEDGRAEDGRAEDGRAEDGRAEDGRAEDGRAEDGRAEDGRAEDGRAEDGRAEDGRAEDRRAEDRRAEDRRAEHRRAKDRRAEDRRAEDGRAEDRRAEDGRAEDSRAEDSRAEDRRAEDGRADDRRADDRRAEEGAAEPESADESRIGVGLGSEFRPWGGAAAGGSWRRVGVVKGGRSQANIDEEESRIGGGDEVEEAASGQSRGGGVGVAASGNASEGGWCAWTPWRGLCEGRAGAFLTRLHRPDVTCVSLTRCDLRALRPEHWRRLQGLRALQLRDCVLRPAPTPSSSSSSSTSSSSPDEDEGEDDDVAWAAWVARLLERLPELSSLLVARADLGDDVFLLARGAAPSLVALDLRWNGVRRVGARSLRGLPLLERLDLRHNAIASLEPGAFAQLRSLRRLDLAHNRLALPHHPALLLLRPPLPDEPAAAAAAAARTVCSVCFGRSRKRRRPNRLPRHTCSAQTRTACAAGAEADVALWRDLAQSRGADAPAVALRLVGNPMCERLPAANGSSAASSPAQWDFSSPPPPPPPDRNLSAAAAAAAIAGCRVPAPGRCDDHARRNRFLLDACRTQQGGAWAEVAPPDAEGAWLAELRNPASKAYATVWDRVLELRSIERQRRRQLRPRALRPHEQYYDAEDFAGRPVQPLWQRPRAQPPSRDRTSISYAEYKAILLKDYLDRMVQWGFLNREELQLENDMDTSEALLLSKSEVPQAGEAGNKTAKRAAHAHAAKEVEGEDESAWWGLTPLGGVTLVALLVAGLALAHVRRMRRRRRATKRKRNGEQLQKAGATKTDATLVLNVEPDQERKRRRILQLKRLLARVSGSDGPTTAEIVEGKTEENQHQKEEKRIGSTEPSPPTPPKGSDVAKRAV